MGDSLDEELAALRARAYGPDADIQDDAGAIARLRSIEDEVRARTAVVVPVRTPAVPSVAVAAPTHADGAALAWAPEAASTPATPAAAGDGRASAARGSDTGSDAAARAPLDESEAPVTQPRRRASARQLLGACLITALAAAAVTVPITLWVAALPDRPYAILHPIDAPPNTVFFSPESEAQRYEDFLGMRISTGALDYQQGRCILIELQPDVDSEFDSGATRGACSAPGFEAVADVSAAESYLSESARAELGDITALRFQVVGDEVHVFVASVPIVTPES